MVSSAVSDFYQRQTGDCAILQSLPSPELRKSANYEENSHEKGDEKQEQVMDDELDRLKPAGLPADMQRWNMEDLQAYVAAMRAEITHVESMIAEKNKVQSAANALFGGVK